MKVNEHCANDGEEPRAAMLKVKASIKTIYKQKYMAEGLGYLRYW